MFTEIIISLWNRRTIIVNTLFALALFSTILSFAACNSMRTREPVKVDFQKCNEDDINPEAYRNAPRGKGVPIESYEKVLDANRNCINAFIGPLKENQANVEYNASLVDTPMDDIKDWIKGNGILVVVVGIAYIANPGLAPAFTLLLF